MNDLLSDIPGLEEMDDVPAAASAVAPISPEDLASLGRIIDPNAWRNENGFWVEQVNIGDAALDKAEQVLAWVRERFGEAVAPKRLRSPPDLVIVLPGIPRGWGRVQSRYVPPDPSKNRPGFISHYTQKETRNYEAMLRYAAEQVMAGRPALEGPLKIRVNVLMPYLKSWSQAKLREVENGYLLPTSKPDWDNFGKVVDGFNGIVWRDDAQVADGRVVKSYSRNPAYEVKIWTRKGNHW